MSPENDSSVSESKALRRTLLYTALQVLKDNEGNLASREVMKEVEKRVSLNEWAKTRYEKSGYVRWKSMLHFYSIACIKSGYLVKKKGVWYLTPEGEEALNLGESAFFESAVQGYRLWKRTKGTKDKDGESDPDATPDEEVSEAIDLDEIEQRGTDSLRSHIHALNAYEFQDLCAALLRGMGYYTPFVAPPGKDGGIDIVAYRDPLGTVAPRIRVQVKHRENTSAPVREVRQLMGLLQSGGDVGMFISTGGFSPDSKSLVRTSSVHVELVDLDRFIQLWQDFYEEMADEDKRLLPLRPIYFLADTD